MNLKTFISFLCLVVLMFQMLPVKQLGSLLFSNQLQEELPHSADGGIEKETKGKLDFKKDFCCTDHVAQINYIYTNAVCYFHFATALPVLHAGEIQTPPPNIA
jgi:hypothetical protein